MSIDEIGFLLMSKDYSPSVETVDWFKIKDDGEEFFVYVGLLPDVFNSLPSCVKAFKD